MSIEEIFSQVSQHMIQGLMVHTQLSDYFYFLGLSGYGKCHEYHYFEESNNFRKSCTFYLENYNRFIKDSRIDNPQVIPENWYMYTRNQVDPDTRKTAIQKGFEYWVKWEEDTLSLYQKMYKELINSGEIASAIFIENCVKDVNNELVKAEQKLLELKIIDFDIFDIMEEQEPLLKKYSKKMKGVELC